MHVTYADMQDGSADEQAMMDLTEELAEKFSIESLELFDALQEVWSNANKSDFATSRKTKVCMYLLLQGVYSILILCPRAFNW